MWHNQRGLILWVSWVFIAAMALAIQAMLVRSMTELSATTRFVASQQAFYMAEAGVDCVIDQLRVNDITGQVATACNEGPDPEGKVRLSVVELKQLEGQPDSFRVTSKGWDEAEIAETQITAILQRRPAQSPFQQGMYGTLDTGIGVWLGWGATIDSYDSNQGDYGGANVAEHAHVQTSSSEPGWAILIHNGAMLHGNANTAPGGGVRVDNAPPPTGTIGTKPPETFPPAPMPAEPNQCTELGDLYVGENEERVFSGQNYCATSITVHFGGRVAFPNLEQLHVDNDTAVQWGGRVEFGQGTVSIMGNLYVYNAGSRVEGTSGQVDLYVGGVQVVDQAVMQGANRQPANLRIYLSPDAQGMNYIDVWSRSKVYAAIYAPGGHVEVGEEAGTELYGSMIATQAMVHSGKLHFDEALANATSWPDWLPSEVSVVAQY